MIMGQIGEYRELNLEEQRQCLGQQCRDAQALERLEADQRDTKTIAELFALTLGCLEDTLCWLGQVNEQYDTEEQVGIRLKDVSGHHRFANPALDFWLQAENAEDVLKDMLRKLRGVEPLAPKEGIAVFQGLVEAIGRHPAAEADPDVADAVNAVEDALGQKEETLG